MEIWIELSHSSFAMIPAIWYLTLSCPEAARLALLNPNIMEFNEIVEPLDVQHIIDNKINTDSIENANNVRKYFWPPRILSISLIQNRKYSLTNRLIILGLFMKKVQEYFNNNRVHEIPSIIEEYDDIIENGNLKNFLNAIAVNLAIQMELMKEFNDERFTIAFSKNAK